MLRKALVLLAACGMVSLVGCFGTDGDLPVAPKPKAGTQPAAEPPKTDGTRLKTPKPEQSATQAL